MEATMTENPECVRYDCAANANGRCFEDINDWPCKITGLLLARNPVAKKRPTTREEFRLAANWLARAALRAGQTVVSLLGGPDKDDEAAGVCIGYRDQRDQPFPKPAQIEGH